MLLIVAKYPRVMSLRSPENKMSKSDPSAKSRIHLNDTPDQIAKAIRKSVTDPSGIIKCDQSRPGITNLIHIYSALSDMSVEKIEEMYEDKDMLRFKSDLTDVVVHHITPIKRKFDKYMENKDYIESVLDAGTTAANKKAEETLVNVKKSLGLLQK